MKSFYPEDSYTRHSGTENGLREDSVRWYYLEGQVFRTTPMNHDTIDGTQKQYYRNGRIKAEIGYIKGLRAAIY